MDPVLFGAGALVLIVISTIVIYGLNEKRLRRRERALGTRRKSKIRL